MAYSTPLAVLKEAGQWFTEVGETPSGTVNGVNTVFTTAHKPLTVSEGSGVAVATSDVTAYVDGIPVTVSGVVATTGAITLASPPATGADVTIDYSYSSVPLDDVTALIEEADAAIDESIVDLATIDSQAPGATVRKISRVYAAGLLMSREYGLQSITEETTKEGERKLKQAEKWLAEFRARYVGDAAETYVPRSTTDKRLFQQYDSSTGTWGPLTDTNFTVRDTTT